MVRVRWGGAGLITFLGTCIWFVLRSQNMLLRLHMLHPMEEPRKIVGSEGEASSGGSMLPSLVLPPWKNSPKLVAELRKDASKPFGHENSWINMHFQTFFPTW